MLTHSDKDKARLRKACEEYNEAVEGYKDAPDIRMDTLIRLVPAKRQKTFDELVVDIMNMSGSVG